MLFAGLDIHKRVVEAVVLDERGKIRHRERFGCSRDELEKFAKRHLGKKARVALEATTNTWAVVGVLEPHVKEVVVSNPLRTRAIAEAKVKTDKVDALVLAQLLRTDFLPTVWKPDTGTRCRRRMTTQRAGLVHDRTRIKNRIHAILHQRLIEPPYDLFSVKGLAWLEHLRLPDAQGNAALDSERRLLKSVEAEIEKLGEALAMDGYDEPRVRLLMTLPGVDVAVAQTLLGALGDATRFKSPDHAAAYLGLAPSTKQSGDHCYNGPITKQGRGHTRWLLVQAAQHIAKHSGPLGVFFRRLMNRKNRNVAVVATARKLVTIAWHMLRNNEPYRYAEPAPTQAKLARHRVRATGEKRKSGPPKGSPRPKPVNGKLFKTIPSIDELYENEGIAPIRPLSDGEHRMLQSKKLLGVLRKNSRPRKVERKPRQQQKAS